MLLSKPNNLSSAKTLIPSGTGNSTSAPTAPANFVFKLFAPCLACTHLLGYLEKKTM